jgi:hypothetical protein
MAKVFLSAHLPFVSVARELHRRDHELIVSHPQFTKTLRDQDLACKALTEFATRQMHQKAMNSAAEVNAKVHGRKCKSNGLLPPVKGFINSALAASMYAELGDLALFAISLEEAKPDILILHNDVEPLMRAAAFWGKAKGVPCVHVPHAIYQNTENKNDIHSIITASHLASSGPYQSGWYTERGLKKEAVRETGLPQFDDFAQLPLDRDRSRDLLGLDRNHPVICYASSWRQDTNLLGMHNGVEEVYQAILACSKQMKDVQFLIKCHPRGNNAQQHLQLAKKAEVKVAITPHHLPQCLMASDLVFAYGPSNILLESSHIPWLRLAATSGYEEDEEVLKIPSDPPNISLMIEALYAALQRPLVDTSGLRQKYLGRCDGRNFLRVCDYVEGVGRG